MRKAGAAPAAFTRLIANVLGNEQLCLKTRAYQLGQLSDLPPLLRMELTS